jgi:hypothetical protein
MFHPKSIPDQECAVSRLCIAVPAEDGLVKLSLNSTRRNECSVGRRHRMVSRCCGGPAAVPNARVRLAATAQADTDRASGRLLGRALRGVVASPVRVPPIQASIR